MNLDNIKEGMVVKNYKELCNLLGLATRAGNQKKSDIKLIESYIKYKKKGHSFIITKIYDKQQSIVDHRGLNPNSHRNQKGAYGKYIRLLVLNMLSQGENEQNPNLKNIIFSGKNEMLEKLNMINDNYRYGSYNRDAMAHYLGMDIKFIHEFYGTNTQKMRQSVETTLNSLMRSEKLIFWSKAKMIGKHLEHREATNDEIKIILDCERSSLLEMGTDKMEHIYASNRLDEFYKKVKAKLNKNGILFSYNGYKIIFSDDVYERNEQLIYKLGVKDQKINETELNEKIFANVSGSIISRSSNTKQQAKDLFFGEPSREWLEQNRGYKSVLTDDDYIFNSTLLAEICIDREYETVCEDISKSWRQHREMEKRKTKSEFDKVLKELNL